MTFSVIQFLPNIKITKTMAATDSQANDGPPLTELESLQLKAVFTELKSYLYDFHEPFFQMLYGVYHR